MNFHKSSSIILLLFCFFYFKFNLCIMGKLRKALQEKRNWKGDLKGMHEDKVIEAVMSLYLDDDGGGGMVMKKA